MHVSRKLQVLLFMIFFTTAAQAQIPRMIHYQGVLINDSNQVVADSNYNLIFRIFRDSTGGIPLYTQNDTLAVENGVFNTLIGEVQPVAASVFDSANAWLETELAGQGVLTPRKRIASVPYAYKALSVANQPGVAQALEGISSATLDTNASNMLTRAINCPDSGWVLAIGTCQPRFSHTKGSESSCNIGVSSVSATLPVDQDHAWNIRDSLPSGLYFNTVTAHKIFPVPPGVNSFYFVGQKTDSSPGTHSVWDLTFSLIYLPTNYGPVSLLEPATRPGATEDASVPAQVSTGSEPAAIDLVARLQALEQEVQQLRVLIESAPGTPSGTSR